ncbi:hypothetical protein CEXT_88151 [Caerostris extrusa]|uniref:Uncharacterized protein n=1 Tax=Caerostris extrusa TaxID=172846 RepID=A0AAV4WGY2_CAEEX|nr:hypothetical protein CEXT_88151 [Caerostris extrusa]
MLAIPTSAQIFELNYAIRESIFVVYCQNDFSAEICEDMDNLPLEPHFLLLIVHPNIYLYRRPFGVILCQWVIFRWMK